MDVTLILAVVGAATGLVGATTGIVSLGWQIRTHNRSGRVVKVEVANVFPTYGEPGTPTASVGDHLIQVSVYNVGGAPVTVTNWGIVTPEGDLLLANHPRWSSRPPVEVTPGGTPAEFYYPAADLRNFHAEHDTPYAQMRPWVSLGDGRKVHADGGLPL